MELRLKRYGTIEITNAKLVEGGDILIESADRFQKIEEITNYKADSAYLTETEYGYGVVIMLEIPEDSVFIDDFISYPVENPKDIQRLKAFL